MLAERAMPLQRDRHAAMVAVQVGPRTRRAPWAMDRHDNADL